MKKNGYLFGPAILVLVLGFVLGACEKKGVAGGAGADPSRQVELTCYIIGGPQPNSPEMEAYANRILAEKLPNTTLKYLYIDWGDLAQGKYELLFSSGEVFDMCYAASWLGLSSLATRGAFMPLDDLFPAYAPVNYARQSPTALRQATFNGRLYAVPSLEKTYTVSGLLYREAGLNLPGWDGKMENFDDLERYIRIVKAYNPGVTGIHAGNEGNASLMRLWMENQGLYSNDTIGALWWFDPRAENPQVLFWADHPSIPEFLGLIERLNHIDAWSKTALSDPAHNRWEQGLIAINFGGFDHYRDWSIKYPHLGIRFLNMNRNVAYGTFTNNALAIPNTSRNPERALMFWDLATNDEELWRAIYYGIEGRSYRIAEQDGEKQYERIFDSNGETVYDFPTLWSIKTPQFDLPQLGAPPEITRQKAYYDTIIKDGEGAQKFQAFVLERDPTDITSMTVNNAHRELFGPLSLGFVDVRTGLANYRQAMRVAGIEKVKQEIQKQLDAYLESLN
ncbi:MAG: ABC transporter substrate-binding protein [Treponema sp.]|jgi:putative aldouronate transport system substrate-binding protein|nr:ABC transporter substrate-binding protein [Treponema sp.]